MDLMTDLLHQYLEQQRARMAYSYRSKDEDEWRDVS